MIRRSVTVLETTQAVAAICSLNNKCWNDFLREPARSPKKWT